MTTLQTTEQRTPAPTHCPDCGAAENTPGRLCVNCFHLKGAAPNVKAATYLQRLAAFILDVILVPLTLVIGYLIWWLITLANGQTPGKQIVGIRAVNADGRPLGWGMTFVREFVIKGLVVGLISWITVYIFWLVNYLFPLFDRDRQALHDKMISTLVIVNPPPSFTAQQQSSQDPWARQ